MLETRCKRTTKASARVYNVRRLSRPKESDKGELCSYRFTSVQTALLYNCDPAHLVQFDRDYETVRGQSHRLHSHEGHSRRRPEHLLLDTFHVHAEELLQQEGRSGGPLPGYREQSRERKRGHDGSQDLQILPVGVLLSVFSGECFSLYHRFTVYLHIHIISSVVTVKITLERITLVKDDSSDILRINNYLTPF